MLLVAHVFGTDQSMWDRILRSFTNEFRVVLFDHVGSGGSDKAAYNSATYSSISPYRIILFRAPERRRYESELAAALRKLEAAEADRQRLLEEARYDALHDSLTACRTGYCWRTVWRPRWTPLRATAVR